LGQDSPVRNSVFWQVDFEGSTVTHVLRCSKEIRQSDNLSQVRFPPPVFFLFFIPPTSGWCINEEIRRKRNKEKAMQKVHVFENVTGGKVICTPRQTCGGTANHSLSCPRAHCGVLVVSRTRLGRCNPRPYQNGFPLSFSSISTGLPSVQYSRARVLSPDCSTARYAGGKF